jgi:outer membrane protein assembly factor BamB
MTRLTAVRTFKLPVGRPLPVGRALFAAGPLAAGRTVAALAAVAAVLAASACAGGSAATSPAATTPAATGATVSAVGPAAAAPAKAVTPASVAHASPGSGVTGSASCPSAAWAYEVGSKGKVLWDVSLPLAPSDGVSDGLPPVLNGAGSEAVLAEGHSLIALRLSDGHRLWRHVFPQAKNSFTGQLTFLYGFHGEVIALVGQVSANSRLVALSQKTGAVIWTLPLGRYAVIGTPVVTIDSVLAFLTPHGVLKAVNLWTGRPLWSRAYGLATGEPALAAEGNAVIAAKTSVSAPTTSSITAFASQTGKPLWTRTGMADQPTLLATLGGVLVYDVDQNVYPQPALFPVTELNPATGKTVWRIPTAGPVSAVWSSLDGPAIVIATVGRTPRLIVADPVQHLVRWSAATSVDMDTAPLIWLNQLLYLKTTSTSTATLVDRDTSSGKVRWSLRVPSALPRYLAFTGNGTWLLSYGQATVPGKAGALVIGLTGKVVAKVSLPVPAQAPPAVTAGHDTLLQLDTLACATFAVGSAVGGAVHSTSAVGAAS